MQVPHVEACNNLILLKKKQITNIVFLTPGAGQKTPSDQSTKLQTPRLGDRCPCAGAAGRSSSRGWNSELAERPRGAGSSGEPQASLRRASGEPLLDVLVEADADAQAGCEPNLGEREREGDEREETDVHA